MFEPLTVADYLLSLAILAIGVGGVFALLWLAAALLVRRIGRSRAQRHGATPEMIATPEFQAVYRLIREWDIRTSPGGFYQGANGSHVRAILDAIAASHDAR